MRGSVRRALRVLLLLVVAAGLLAVPGHASAATNGDIVFADGDLYLVHADGTGVRALTSAGDAHNPAWSPDGRSVAYDHAGDVWVLTLGHAPRRLTFDRLSGDPTWSPDGTRIAYVHAVRLYLRDIFVRPAAGGAATRISWTARAGCTAQQPTWSPTGVLVYVRASALQQCATGLVVQRPGSPAHLVVADPAASWPDVTANGTRLLFLAPCDPAFCNGSGGWETTLSGANRHLVVDRYLCAEGDLCLHRMAASPAGGWVEAATYADEDTGLVETCFQGAHETTTGVVLGSPSFCLLRLAYDFDVRAA